MIYIYMNDNYDIKYVSFPKPEYVIFNKIPHNYVLNSKNYSLIINNIYDPYDNELIELKIMTSLVNKELFSIIYDNISNFLNGYTNNYKIAKTIEFNYKIYHRGSSHLKCIIINLSIADWKILKKYIICVNCCQLIHKSLREEHKCFEIIPKKIYIN